LCFRDSGWVDEKVEAFQMTKRRRVLVMADLEWNYKRHHHVFAGVERYAREHPGWEWTLDVYAEQSLDAARVKVPYDGIIGRATAKLTQLARHAGVPLVNIWANSPVTDVPLVTPDFHAAGRMAAEHLVARGFRHFGYLGFSRQKIAKEQLAGFQAVLNDSGFPCSVLLTSGRYRASEASRARFGGRMHGWIDSWSLPIGIYAAYDLLCRYVACACVGKNVHVPGNAALVGTHNEPVTCAGPPPALSSIELGYDKIGYRAAELLESLMAGEPAPTEPIRMAPVELVARQSTDALAVADPLVSGALRFISEHSHERIWVPDVARSVQSTRRTLERRFRAALGRTVAKEITRMRVERLKRLLVESRTPMNVLAKQCGFRDPTQTCVIFRRVEGLTPSAYRRQRRGS